MNTLDIIGWLGTTLLLSAYLFLSAHKITSSSKTYLGLNALGAGSLFVASVPLGAIQPLILNGMFVTFSILGLLRIKLFKIKGGLAATWAVITVIGVSQGYITSSIYEALAMAGALMLLGNYMLFSQKQISQKSFLLSNLVANIIFLPILYITENWPSVAMQIIAILITLFGLYKIFKKINKAVTV